MASYGKIDAVSFNEDNQNFGIKNYFLEAQKRTAALGQGVKKRMPPLFNEYLQANASSNAGFVQPGNANYLGTTNK